MSTVDNIVNILFEDAVSITSKLNFDILKNKKILVTGANGLIGVNFLSSLNIISEKIDNVSIFPVFRKEPVEYLLPLLKAKSIHPLYGDLTDNKFINSLPKCDYIIHSAGSGIPTKFMENALATLKINTFTTFYLFEKLSQGGKFLFLSSSDIYNGLKKNIFSENQTGNTSTDHPRACYIEGKRTGETICNIYRSNGVNAFAVRLSLTYGPGLHINDERVLPAFIQKGMSGKINLLDSGNAKRTFCYISDALEMMWYVLLFGNKGIYNIGGINQIKIVELAQIIGDLLNVEVVLPKYKKSILGAPENVKINIERILQEYPKNDFISVKEGLIKTISWYKYLNEFILEKKSVHIQKSKGVL